MEIVNKKDNTNKLVQTSELKPKKYSSVYRYDMCRRRKGGRCTKGTAGNQNKNTFNLFV